MPGDSVIGSAESSNSEHGASSVFVDSSNRRTTERMGAGSEKSVQFSLKH